MGAVTGLVAGLVTVAGGVALYRFAERKARQMREAIDETRRRGEAGRSGAILDYERDPDSGVYRQKSL